MSETIPIDEAVRQKALEGLSRLQAITGLAAYLAMRGVDQTVVAETLPAAAGIEVPAAQLWQSAAGRVLAAGMAKEEQLSLLEDFPDDGNAENGISARRKAAARLSLIRARGYEIDPAESADGMASAAAPIIGSDGCAIAAIGLMAVEMSRRRLHELGAALVEATREAAAIAGGTLRPNSRAQPPSTPASSDVHLLSDVANLIGESPLYDSANNRLYWVDMYDPSVYCLDLHGEKVATFFSGEAVLALGLVSDGLLMATQSGLWLADPDRCTPQRWLGHPETDFPSNRFNDGKCDRRGRFWVNTTDYNFRPGAGALYRYQQGGGFVVQDTGLSVPNGMGWSPDGRTMYLCDTGERIVFAYDCDEETGNIANRRILVRVPGDAPGAPDGLTVDRNGNLWIAFFDGWRIGQFAPAGDHMRDIILPVPRPTGCVFGAGGNSTLFITSARIRLGKQLLETAPLSGGLFAYTGEM